MGNAARTGPVASRTISSKIRKPGRRVGRTPLDNTSPAIVAGEVAFHRQVLEEDLGLMGVLASAGLPLDVREELHVPADRLGVALRRALCDFATARRERAAA